VFLSARPAWQHPPGHQLHDEWPVLNSYTYGPFGEMIAADSTETIDNPFKFTGQYYDYEIGQYYLRARQYDPQLMRFTGRDPIASSPQEPMSLHKYLYCVNNPINLSDPMGLEGDLTSEEAALEGDAAAEGVGEFSYNSLLKQVKNFVKGINYQNKLTEIATRGDKGWEYAKGALDEWHHIVGKGWKNASRFVERINSPDNLIKLPEDLHNVITRFFGRGYEFLPNGGTLQQWLATQSWEKQMEFSFNVLMYALENNTMEGFFK
jgi:RHS repeat-associated protein